jgi:hypothetical protein
MTVVTQVVHRQFRVRTHRQPGYNDNARHDRILNRPWAAALHEITRSGCTGRPVRVRPWA